MANKMLAVRIRRSDMNCLEKTKAVSEILRGKNVSYWRHRVKQE